MAHKCKCLIIVLLTVAVLRPKTGLADEVMDADGVAAAAAAHGASGHSKPYWKEESQAERDARLEWWKEDRFGMLICWGLYSILAGEYQGEKVPGVGEWILHNAKIPIAEYRALGDQWNPVRYDPEEWVLAAKQAGMKYIVITAKFCDGFTLWPTAVDDWGVQATPYQKDLLKPLEQACRKHGLKFGVYYSHNWDWFHPGGTISGKGKRWDEAQKGDYETYFKTWALPQFKELISHFDQLDLLWFDVGFGNITARHEKQYLDLLREQRPQIIINDRLAPPTGKFRGDYITPEGQIPGHAPDADWETCMTMDGTWGYTKFARKNIEGRRFVEQLIDCVSKGGNFLLNVGPTAEGVWPEHQKRALKEVGEWMALNSESIYGCGISPIHPTGWGLSTAKQTAGLQHIYLHITDWPEDNKLFLQGLKSEGNVSMLTSGKACTTHRTTYGTEIELGPKPAGPSPIVVTMSFEGDIDIEPYRVIPTDPQVIDLGPWDAVITAEGRSDHIKTPYPNASGLDRWTDSKATCTWRVQIDQPGSYQVQMNATFSKANVVVVRTAQQALKTAVNTKDKSYTMGDLTFETPGIHEIRVNLQKTSGWNRLQKLTLIKNAGSPDPYAEETKAERDARMAWWREAKFGMFIHWGVYAVPAGSYNGKMVGGIGEWIMHRAKIPVSEYKAFAPRFTASKYDPAAWAALAKRAGMRYMVITAKHHDGFALYDSKVTDWDAVDAAGAGRDLIGPLATAARKEGLKFGLYYSQAQDWTHPGGAKQGMQEGESWDNAHKGDFDAYLRTIAEPQVEEILSSYKPDILWWDTPKWMNTERAARLIPSLRRVPGIIHNNRLGGGFKGDTETPEQHIPATGFRGRDWEVCMTMNQTWGYKSYDHQWKSVEDLIHKLCDIVSKGGNFLLNVGPTAEGEIPQPSIDRLEAVGRWMAVNGEAIYGTLASPFHKLLWGRCTRKEHRDGVTLYLHVFDWPADGRLPLPDLRSEVAKASLLAGGEPLRCVREEEGVTVLLPESAPDPIASVVKLEIVGPLDVESVSITQEEDGRIALDAAYADVNNPGYGMHAKIETKDGKPNLGFWIDHRSWVQWSFKVRQPGRFSVTAEVAGPDDTALEWGVDGKKTPCNVAATGGYNRYEMIELGQVAINDSGTHTLSVRPLMKGWKPVNLRAVVLTPVP